jgi:Zn-dependent protease with chaperone function
MNLPEEKILAGFTDASARTLYERSNDRAFVGKVPTPFSSAPPPGYRIKALSC